LQSLSKKERKKMELEDLDGLLDEFGLGSGGSNEETDDVKGIEEMETKGHVDMATTRGVVMELERRRKRRRRSRRRDQRQYP
jgi:hypothetical protein